MLRLINFITLLFAVVASMLLSPYGTTSASADGPVVSHGAHGASAARQADLWPVPRTETKTIAAQWQARVLLLTNQARARAGCRPLRHNRHLEKAAVRHSKRMAQQGRMVHRLPGERGFARRITDAGYRTWRRVGENIAAGFLSPEAALDAWMGSPSHRRNILNCQFRDLGVGVIIRGGRSWMTQDFGRRI